MTDAASSVETLDPLWDRRRRLLLAATGLLIGVAVVAKTGATAWRWSLFWWGVLIGLAACALIVIPAGFAMLRADVDPDRKRGARRRLVIYSLGWPFMGVLLGSLAAMFDAAWVDIAFAAFVAVSALGIGVVLVVVLRRYRQRDHS